MCVCNVCEERGIGCIPDIVHVYMYTGIKLKYMCILSLCAFYLYTACLPVKTIHIESSLELLNESVHCQTMYMCVCLY